jgi:hypothetical protein
LLAFAFGGLLTLAGSQRARRARRRASRICDACGRLIVRGQRTCDCDL